MLIAPLPSPQVTYDDPLAHANPCFYCAFCFSMMHEDADGRRMRPEVMVYAYESAAAPVGAGADVA
jgi:hypothetical protein